MTRVLAFGAFDPLHAGHRNFFLQARQLGDHLQVVVASDAALKAQKHEPYQPQVRRVAAVAADASVDEARVGSEAAWDFSLLRELHFDILVLGYDQAPTDEDVRQQLVNHDKAHVRVVRLQPFRPDTYKSSRLRP